MEPCSLSRRRIKHWNISVCISRVCGDTSGWVVPRWGHLGSAVPIIAHPPWPLHTQLRPVPVIAHPPWPLHTQPSPVPTIAHPAQPLHIQLSPVTITAHPPWHCTPSSALCPHCTPTSAIAHHCTPSSSIAHPAQPWAHHCTPTLAIDPHCTPSSVLCPPGHTQLSPVPVIAHPAHPPGPCPAPGTSPAVLVLLQLIPNAIPWWNQCPALE